MNVKFDLIIAHDCKFIVLAPTPAGRLELLFQECTGYSLVDVNKYSIHYLNIIISTKSNQSHISDIYKYSNFEVDSCILSNPDTGEKSVDLRLVDNGQFTKLKLEFQLGETIELAIESVKKSLENVVDTLDFWNGSLSAT